MKDIKGYEGKYAITEDGRVWSYLSHKYLELKIAQNQYRQVCLYKDGRKKMFYVHRLVAEAFIPNPEQLQTVNHINLNKGDNRVENLEWLSIGDNVRHYYRLAKEGIQCLT